MKRAENSPRRGVLNRRKWPNKDNTCAASMHKHQPTQCLRKAPGTSLREDPGGGLRGAPIRGARRSRPPQTLPVGWKGSRLSNWKQARPHYRFFGRR